MVNYNKELESFMIKGECPLCHSHNIGFHRVFTRGDGFKHGINCNECGYGKIVVFKPNYTNTVRVFINGKETNLVVDNLNENTGVLQLSVHRKPLTFKDIVDNIRKNRHLVKSANFINDKLENEFCTDVTVKINKSKIMIFLSSDKVKSTVKCEDISALFDIPLFSVMDWGVVGDNYLFMIDCNLI